MQGILGNQSNPYDVLGIDRNAPFSAVRSQYIALAKRHHPDKLAKDISDEDLKAHEEQFKNYTLAYRKLERLQKTGTGTGTTWSEDFGSPDSNVNWSSVFKNVFQEALNEVKRRYHVVRVPITLEEIHTKKRKKLELFLKGCDTPLYLHVNCGLYPKTTIIESGHIIKIRFQIEKHNCYHLDEILGTNDLYTTCNITWGEYLKGIDIPLKHLDDTTVMVSIVPCMNIELPLIFKHKGLWGIGDLYVKIQIVTPTADAIAALDDIARKKLFEILDAMDAHERRAGNERTPKTI